MKRKGCKPGTKPDKHGNCIPDWMTHKKPATESEYIIRGLGHSDKKSNFKMYPVTRTCKTDLRELFKNNKDALERIELMDDAEMRYLAEKLADVYVNEMYWNSLEQIFKEVFLKGEQRR